MKRSLKRIQLIALAITFVGAAAAAKPASAMETVVPCTQDEVNAVWEEFNESSCAPYGFDCVQTTCNDGQLYWGVCYASNGGSCRTWICYYDYDTQQWVGDC